jgi:hypothetical protein
MTTRYGTREEWLQAAADQIVDVYAEIAPDDFPGVPRVRVGVGFPSAGKRSKVGAECWSTTVSGDKTHEIIMRIEITDPARVLDILAHELAHAVDDNESGHKGRFGRLARAFGLTGPLTATTASDDLRETLTQWVRWTLGAYPMATFGTTGIGITPGQPGTQDGPIVKSSGPRGGKPQGTRMIKRWCDTAEDGSPAGCGYSVRLTQKWLDVATPRCPNTSCKREGLPLAA